MTEHTGTLTADYTVTGMTCEHCVASVKEEVGEVAGVTKVDVDLATGRVTITSASTVDPTAVTTAVRAAGYEVTG